MPRKTSSNPNAHPPGPPPVSLGHFRVAHVLGSGGEGIVWMGYDVGRTRRPVAVKVMSSRYADDPTYRGRFYAEVRAMAALTHPRIAAILDYGLVSHRASIQSEGRLPAGSPFLVMEYAPGGPLQSILPIRNFQRAKRILLDVLDGLAHAHARGVVHRDIKPGNILIKNRKEGDPEVLLTDFGIAFAIVDSMPGNQAGNHGRLRIWHHQPPLKEKRKEDSAPLVSAQAGTPAYMAPEQIHGDLANIGPWTDLYALGCVAYRLVTGHTPFYVFGPKVEKILDAHLYGTVPPLRPLFSVPDGLQEWFSSMLAKAPWKRFQTAAEAADALRALDGRVKAMLRTTPNRGPHGLPGNPGPSLHPNSAQTDDDFPTSRQKPAGTASRTANGPDHGNPGNPAEVIGSRFFPKRTFPTDWESIETERQANDWITASPNLFGLRNIPFVDRRQERSLLWDSLGGVISQRAPFVVGIHGPAGVGKSRLARWLCETAAEIGWAEVFTASHSPFPSGADGLGAMLARVLRCQGLTPYEMYRQTRHVLEALGPEDDQTEEDLDFLAMALARLMSARARLEPGQDTLPAGLLTNQQARFAVVSEFLRRKALHRPVILWLDDVQWGLDSLALAHFVMKNLEASPLFVLLTYRDEELPDRPREAALIERILRSAPGRHMGLAPLDANDQKTMIKQMVALDDPLVEAMVRRTGAYPLYAIQLITDWLDRGILRDNGDGITLAEEANTTLPDDIYEMWNHRIDRMNQRFGDHAHKALEIAAALGGEIDEADWVSACKKAKIPIPDGMTDWLIETGLAHQTEAGWTFIHPMLRETLQRHAQENGRWTKAHRACAQALVDRHGEGPSEWSGDIGRHWFEAGDWEQAVTPLLQAAERSSLKADFPQALETLDLAAGCLERVEGTADSRTMLVRILRAKVLFQKGDFDTAQELLDQILTSKSEVDPTVRADAWRSMARLLRMRGKLLEARHAAENGARLFRELGNQSDAATCDVVLARLHFESTGDNSLGLELAQSAEELFREKNDEANLAETQYIEALLLVATDRRQEAIFLTQKARVRYAKVGNRFGEAACENFLGEVARHAHRFHEAVSHYGRAAKILQSIGSDWTHVQRINMALTLVQNERYAPAKRILEGLRRQDFGMKAAVSCYIDYALLVCSAEAGDWDTWDEEYHRASQVRPETGRVDRDLAELALLAAQRAAEAKENERAARALSLSRDHWRALGDDDKLQQCQAIFNALVTTQ